MTELIIAIGFIVIAYGLWRIEKKLNNGDLLKQETYEMFVRVWEHEKKMRDELKFIKSHLDKKEKEVNTFDLNKYYLTNSFKIHTYKSKKKK